MVYLALYVVATPIGNLDDMTLRALETLRRVDAIIAEDTRTYRTLATRHGIPAKSVYSLYKGNESARIEQILPRLRDGLEAALVTESGTPAVSDPGALLVRRCLESGVRVIPIPGPSSLTAALSVAGVFAERIIFIGFLPKNNPAGAIVDLLLGGTAVVCFEHPARLVSTLKDLAARAPTARVVITRELTKKFEECRAGSAADAQKAFDGRTVKGEVAIIIEAAPDAGENDDAKKSANESALRWLKSLRDESVSLSSAVRVVSQMLNLPKRAVYAEALKLWEAA